MRKGVKIAVPTAMLGAGALLLPASPAIANPNFTPAQARALAQTDPAFRAALIRDLRALAQTDASFRAQLIQAIRNSPAAMAELRQSPEFVAAVKNEMRSQAGSNNYSSGSVSSAGARAAQIALGKVGSAYTYSGSGPSSFDCSGLVMWSFRQVGVSLPHYSGAQFSQGRRVSLNEMQPGDVMYWGAGGSRHAAIYIGNGEVVHATNPRSGVVRGTYQYEMNRGDFAGVVRHG